MASDSPLNNASKGSSETGGALDVCADETELAKLDWLMATLESLTELTRLDTLAVDDKALKELICWIELELVWIELELVWVELARLLVVML